MTISLADMAREIERLRPGTLPKSIIIEYDEEGNPMLSIDRWNDEGFTDGAMGIPDDLAHAILRDAMVIAGLANRNLEGWEFFDDDGDMYETLDRDHDGCPTRSLFAAFVAVFKEAR